MLPNCLYWFIWIWLTEYSIQEWLLVVPSVSFAKQIVGWHYFFSRNQSVSLPFRLALCFPTTLQDNSPVFWWCPCCVKWKLGSPNNDKGFLWEHLSLVLYRLYGGICVWTKWSAQTRNHKQMQCPPATLAIQYFYRTIKKKKNSFHFQPMKFYGRSR